MIGSLIASRAGLCRARDFFNNDLGLATKMLLYKKLLIGAGVLSVVLIGCFVVINTVEYRPYGVPESRLVEYEQKVEQIKRHNAKIGTLEGTPKPIARLGVATHDFGFVIASQSLEYKFELKNAGQEDLLLVGQKEYLNGSVSFEERIAPGARSELQVRWVPQFSGDTSTQTFGIRTNDPLNPDLQITVTAKRRQALLLPEAIGLESAQMGERATGYFEVLTQTTESMEIKDVHCDLPEFVWTAEPLDMKDASMRDDAATAGYKVMVSGLPATYGKFSRELDLEILQGDKLVHQKLSLRGRVKTPITFNHPDMHKTEGLDIGTIGSEKRTVIHIQVRLRGEGHRSLAVLDRFPKELSVQLLPSAKLEGVYKLRIAVEPGTPTTQFNRADQRGYVTIGDPKDPDFSNWLPIYGVIAAPE